MSSRARSYTVQAGAMVDLGDAALAAMRRNGRRYLRPDFSGMGVPGLEKLASSLPRWLEKARSPASDLRLAASLMERAGTGGSLFRSLYRDFLAEAAALLPARAGPIRQAHRGFARSAEMWARVAGLLEVCAGDGRAEHLTEAALLVRRIAEEEGPSMEILARL